LAIPALAGFALMYLYPFARTLWYSMIDGTYTRQFVLFDNYRDILENAYFRLALRNTATFSLIGVCCIVALSLALSFGLMRLGKRFGFVKNLLVSPMILPTASVIFIWQLVFGADSYREIALRGEWADLWTILPIFLLYVWKNTGLNIIIISAAIAGVPTEIHDAALLDGCKGFRLHRSVTIPLIAPALTFVTVLSFVSAFNNYRESFLFFRTNYPPEAAYTLPYYMSNHFQKLNYPTLTAASVLFTVVISVSLWGLYRWESKNAVIY